MCSPLCSYLQVNTVTTTWIGLHFGLVLKHSSMNGVMPLHRILHWFTFASILIISGLIIHFTTFMPMNKQLWSLSYSLFIISISETYNISLKDKHVVLSYRFF